MIHELRVGNYVWGVSDRIEKVWEVHQYKVVVGHPFMAYEGNTWIPVSGEHIKPIELTGSILQKCGYLLGDDGIWDHEEFDLWLYPTKEGLFFSTYIPDGGVPIKFLHQLQNLYFSLTGKELNFRYK